MFSCSRCNKEFTRKGHLIEHLRKQKPCEGTLDRLILIEELKQRKERKFECPLCDREFSSKQKLASHISTEVCVKQQTNSLIIKSETERALEEKVELLESRISSLEKKPNNTFINNGTVVINAFNFDKIPNINIENVLNMPDFDNFIEYCISKDIGGLCSVISKEHFDTEQRSNCNVRVKDIEDTSIEVFNGKEWVKESHNKVLEQLLHNTFYVFNKYFERHNILERINEIDNVKLREFVKEVAIPLYGKNYSYPNNINSSSIEDKYGIEIDVMVELLCSLIKCHVVLESYDYHFTVK